MPIVLEWLILWFLFDEIKSTKIFWLTKAFAKVKAVKPEPSIQTLILFLILTTKIRWYKVVKLIHKYGYKKNS